jgi:Raf kinase inhibitor-like YbhB/YbcL family protein
VAFRLESSAFADDGQIPTQHTADGPDLSPPMSWSDPPPDAAAFALVVEDPDAPGGTFAHWLLWNLPPGARSLPQDVRRVRHLPDGSRQGENDYGRLGWGGPAPPKGREHRYVFRLIALRQPLGLRAGALRADLVSALEREAVGEARCTGRYGR